MTSHFGTLLPVVESNSRALCKLFFCKSDTCTSLFPDPLCCCLYTFFHLFVCLFFSVRVTILRDKDTRESKGVAFVLFLDRQMAHKAVTAINRKQVLLVSWLSVATKISLLATIYNSVYLPRIVTSSSSLNTSLSIILKYAYANARIEFALFALYILDKQKQKQKQLKSWTYKLDL